MTAPLRPLAGTANVCAVEADSGSLCVSDRRGDIQRGATQGLFYRGARVLAQWELTVEGRGVEQVAFDNVCPGQTRFLLRVAPHSGPESTVLLERHRMLGHGLTETITVRNLGHEDTALTLTLDVDADFADLTDVKHGRPGAGGADVVISGEEMLFTDDSDAGHGVAVIADGEPAVTPGLFRWHAVVPAHDRWQATVFVQPVHRHRRSPVVGTEAPREPDEPNTSWRATPTRVHATAREFARVLAHTETDLATLAVRHGDGRPAYLAAGAPWSMSLSGRDSMLSAWMTLPLDPELALTTLRTLAATQGTTCNPHTEEEPGRIIRAFHGPGEPDRAGACYGSVDTTPLFVMLLGEALRWGADPGEVRRLLPAADAALAWIDGYGDLDGDGFVEYRRHTDRGRIHQSWKDSCDCINDAHGHRADPPIALAEVQGYAYAAELARAELAEAFGDIRTAERMRARAADRKKRFDAAFWISERGHYALGLDGHKNHIDALTSNPAHCLWTGIVADARAAELVESLARRSMTNGFGLRTLGADMAAYNPMSHHNGAVWPHDTAIAVAGLLRYRQVPGAKALAETLTAGLLDAAGFFDGRLPELFCGFDRTEFPTPVPHPASCAPHAVAAAAPLLLLRSWLGLQPDVPRRTLVLHPSLPHDWGTVRIGDLRLGSATVHITAHTNSAEVTGLPADWQLRRAGTGHGADRGGAPFADDEHVSSATR
ncbi:amylo-alpha-1,6-glucosidase [Nocardia farcinica]|uniref:amylo-alpha-1,6-glucosidase n=1 Tax=Nocardia farcinica TaxID=37329 RepID=UPI001894E1A4|nr:glycogen debranching N-terminal domain-containing protein [Nocardia farcinica]MBF6230018.1 amylo-alpha-1,6-glucosidase [Nocardia farcinica]